MANPIPGRNQLYRAISSHIGSAQASLELLQSSPRDAETVKKVVAAFGSLHASVLRYKRYSPNALGEIAGGIGVAQNLLLDAEAILKRGKNSRSTEAARDQLKQWQDQLEGWRLSKEGATRPEWLNDGASTTGILMTWRGANLDRSDSPASSPVARSVADMELDPSARANLAL